MLAYVNKNITFFSIFYTLLMLSTMIQAFAGGNITTNNPPTQEISKKENIDFQVNELDKKFLVSNTNKEDKFKKKDNNISTSDTGNVIASNIQTVSNILSSSPSELAEQAKSYTLGKFNSAVSSEAQKWLSQFGTVRINFGLDKKGTLENNSLDLLLPFYDNKTDWLLFSQFGYRNKDSRNTINVGLGGRYFYQNWMYGLNTFYDHDLTGKNQRLGLGGEIWGDYIKLSANAYWRLSDWQKSQNFKGYQERPANGYDINGEFFLPAYPSLGAKLTYEKYFGDNVTLFNRDTKQKNPSLAKLGLTYTPIPLFTIGVDYKQGERSYTETQFLANLNYKLGVPLSVQLSPENVASMRTLAGSRYDLVERNNNIVLEHQKNPIAQLSLPKTIIGYSQGQHEITANLSSNTSVKQIHWTTDKNFENNDGKLSSDTGNTIKITLPKYLSGDNQNNNYSIYAHAELEDDQKLAPVEISVIVRPFMLKKQKEANFTPTGPLPATGKKEDGYTFNPVITFDTVNNTPIKNTTINHVQWITDPKISPESGLQFIDWENSDTVALDENGYFKHKPVLVSSQPHKGVKVYLQLDDQPQQLVGEIDFYENPANLKVDKVEVLPAVPSLVADGIQIYTYTAIVLDGNKPAQNKKITNMKWNITRNGQDETDNKQLILNPQGDITGGGGELTATLASKEALDNLQVSLSIENHSPVHAKQLVSFNADPQNYQVKDIHVDQKGPLTADGIQKYTYTAVITDGNGNKLDNTKISNVKWGITRNGQDETDNKQLILNPKGDITGGGGELTATLASKEALDNLQVSLSIENHSPVHAKQLVSFNADPKNYQVKDIHVDQKGPLTADGIQKYTYTAVITDGNGNKLDNTKISNVKWSTNKGNVKELTLTAENETTGSSDGKLTAHLTSKKEVSDVLVSLSIESRAPVWIEQKYAVSFKPERMSQIEVSPATPILVNKTYTLTVKVTDDTGKAESNQKVNWSIKDTSQQGLTFNPVTSTIGTDGKATTTLTSTQVQNVTVVASVDGIETKEADVVFAWPTIMKPTFTPASGNVTADADKHPNNAYHYTAQVYSADGKIPYTEKDIKFKWRLKPLANGNAPQNTWLSETGEVTTESDGTLKVNLMSSQLNPVMTDVVVCLAVVGKNSTEIPSTEQCADPVSFVKPVEDLKIDNINVDFDPSKLIKKGDGSEYYTYTAKVVKADGSDTELDDGYEVNAIWDTVQIAEDYNGKPEWIITSDNTVKNGFITAKLSSQVGIGDFKNGQITNGLTVRLTVQAGNGKTDSRETSKQVAFDIVPQKSGVFVYIKESDGKTIRKSKIFEDQNRPNNMFQVVNMYAKLYDLKIKKNILDEGGKIIDTKGFGGSTNAPYVDLTTGEIALNNVSQTANNTSITIQRTNQAKYTYEYSFWVKNSFSIKAIQGVVYPDNPNGSMGCEQTGLTGLRDADELDVGISGNSIYSLKSEFPDSYSWGLFDLLSPNPPQTTRIIASYLNNRGKFAYDTQTGTVTTHGDTFNGYMLCVLSYFSH
ncbi:inverse autotransporter beta domain-containing protein [Xenorhabdus sp. PB62.4]|uniref:inverse autotransporter beta domain-containing protein n=1 Tax=Xenorhabdus sp. PB62.4 TaxID=1851573 RepID=UPI0016574AAD|nr:inverse autotransporter beta domain-containing protein [Xenorhabdus sp. PB62.4]MBC8953527.1 putative invasin [Xenorhabdus sp. PB62.4]